MYTVITDCQCNVSSFSFNLSVAWRYQFYIKYDNLNYLQDRAVLNYVGTCKLLYFIGSNIL